MDTEIKIIENRRIDTAAIALGLFAVLVLALLMRIPGLRERSFSMDEGYQIYHELLLFATGASNMLRGAIGTASFDYVFSYLGLQIFDGELGARLFALIHGMATIPVIYLLASRLFRSPAAGLAAALVLACSPEALLFSQTARPYSALSFYQTLTELFFLYYLQSGRRSFLAGFLISGAINQLIYPLAIMQLVSHFGLAAALALSPALRSAVGMRVEKRSIWVAVAALAMLTGLLAGVHFIQATDQQFKIPVFGFRPFTLNGLYETLAFHSAGGGLGLLPTVGGLFLLLGRNILGRRPVSVALLIFLLITPYLTVAVVTTLLGHNYGARYLLGYYPLWIIAGLGGWFGLIKPLGMRFGKIAGAGAATMFIIVVTGWAGAESVGAIRYQNSTASPTTSIDWKALDKRLGELRDETPVLFDPFHIIPTYLYATFSLLYFRDDEKRLNIYSDYSIEQYSSARQSLPEKFKPIVLGFPELAVELPLAGPIVYVLPIPNLDFWANRDIDRFWVESDFGARPEFIGFKRCIADRFDTDTIAPGMLIVRGADPLADKKQLGHEMYKILNCYSASYSVGTEVGSFVPVFFAARMRRSLEKIGEYELAAKLLSRRFPQVYNERLMRDIERMQDLD